jgi:hypothetical protein
MVLGMGVDPRIFTHHPLVQGDQAVAGIPSRLLAGIVHHRPHGGRSHPQLIGDTAECVTALEQIVYQVFPIHERIIIYFS